MENQTYRIHEVNLPKLEAKLEKINKKAAKLNCKPVTLEIVSIEHQEVEKKFYNDIIGTEIHRWYNVRINGFAPSLNGWEFVASIEFADTGNIVHAVPGHTYPERYRNINSICEHCNTDRKRKNTYILHNINTNEFKAVGRTCLKDFLGHPNPEDYASLLEAYADEEYFGTAPAPGSGYESRIDIQEYLPIVAWCIEHHGWVSKSRVAEEGGCSTADYALSLMFPLGFESQKEAEEMRKTLQPKHRELASNTISWVENLTETQKQNDYLYNLSVLFADRYVTKKNLGFVASAIASYQKHLEKQREIERKAQKAAISEFFGTVGKREIYELTLIDVKYWENDFGVTAFAMFEDQNGNIAVWKTQPHQIAEIETGEVIKLKGTVKDHQEYKGTKQTVLSRCKII